VPNKNDDLQVGDSFILNDPIDGKHLNVIVAEVSPGEHSPIILVYITSSTNYQDTTTIIQTGEHPFIINRTYARQKS